MNKIPSYIKNKSKAVWSFLKSLPRKFRQSPIITKTPNTTVEAATLASKAIYIGSNSVGVVRTLLANSPNELANIACILSGANNALYFWIKLVAATKSYNLAEEIVRLNYPDRIRMFDDKKFFAAQLVQFLLLSVTLYSSSEAIGHISDENKTPWAIQLIGATVSVLFSESIHYFFINNRMKEIKENAPLTQAQKDAHNQPNFHFWNVRGLTVLGKTQEQLATIESDVVKIYISQKLLSVEEAIHLLANHRSLLVHEKFNEWLNTVKPSKKTNELKKIIALAGADIAANNLEEQAVYNLISNEGSRGKLSMHIAVQLRQHHLDELSDNPQLRQLLSDGVLKGRDFLKMRAREEIIIYIANQIQPTNR